MGSVLECPNMLKAFNDECADGERFLDIAEPLHDDKWRQPYKGVAAKYQQANTGYYQAWKAEHPDVKDFLQYKKMAAT